jgi:hypothetical protein
MYGPCVIFYKDEDNLKHRFKDKESQSIFFE